MKALSVAEKAIDRLKKDESDLSDDLNLTYVNNHGETIKMKVDAKGNPYFNHSDAHERSCDFVPTESRFFIILESDEKSIISLFETMAFIQQKNKFAELN